MSDLFGIELAFIWFLKRSNSLTHSSGGVDASPSVLFAIFELDVGWRSFREGLLCELLPGNLAVAVRLFWRDAVVH